METKDKRRNTFNRSDILVFPEFLYLRLENSNPKSGRRNDTLFEWDVVKGVPK